MTSIEAAQALWKPSTVYLKTAGFDLTHFMEHRDEKLPVSVTLEERSGTLYALAIDDA